MISKIKNNILNLMTNQVTKEDFLKNLKIDINIMSNVILDMLKIAYNNQDKNLLEEAIYLLFTYEENIDLKKYVDMLNKIICENWHTEHENIALLLEDIAYSSSVDALYKNIFAKYDYLLWDTNYALAVKCIYGLGAIATDSAIKKLKQLSIHDNEIIRKNSLYQLKKLCIGQ